MKNEKQFTIVLPQLDLYTLLPFVDDETVENNELHQKDKSLTFCYQLFTHTNKKKESSIPR